jgi:DNA-binding MarR family transcriptional regulator
MTRPSHDPALDEKYNMLNTAGALVRRAQQIHAAIWTDVIGNEVTSTQCAVLLAVKRFPEADQTVIGQEASLDSSTTQAVVVRLISRGLLVRERSRQDRRRWQLRLTARGNKLLESVIVRVHAISATMLECLSEEEAGLFVGLLRRVVEANEGAH